MEIKRKNTTIYPFEEFNSFLNEFEKIHTSFFSSYENEIFNHRILKIDKEKNEIKLLKDSYEEGEVEYSVIKFETDVHLRIYKIISNSINVMISGFESHLPNNRIEEYKNTLLSQLKKIEENQNIKRFQFLYKYIIKLKEEIEYYSTSQNFGEFKSRYFTVKENVKTQILREIYYIGVDNFLFQDDLTFDDFSEILSSTTTTKKLKFGCPNSLFITYMEKLRLLFIDLEPDKIEKSKRFLTKQSNIITKNIYDSSKSRRKNSKLLEKLEDELNNLDLPN